MTMYTVQYGTLDEPSSSLPPTSDKGNAIMTARLMVKMQGMELPDGWPEHEGMSTTLTDHRAADGKGAFVKVTRTGGGKE